MDKKWFLIPVNMLVILYFFLVPNFLFSYVLLGGLIFLILDYYFYNLKHYNGISYKYCIFTFLIAVGLIHLFYFKNGVLYNNLILGFSIGITLSLLKWIFYYDKYDYNFIFSIITYVNVFFLTGSNIYLYAIIITLIPFEFNEFINSYQEMKSKFPNISRGTRLLDAKAEDGFFLYGLEKKTGCKGTGVEDDDNKIWYATKVLNLEVIKGDFPKLNFDKNFDVIIKREYYYLSINSDEFFDKCKSVLNNDGFIILQSNDINSKFSELAQRHGFELTQIKNTKRLKIQPAQIIDDYERKVRQNLLGYNPDKVKFGKFLLRKVKGFFGGLNPNNYQVESLVFMRKRS